MKENYQVANEQFYIADLRSSCKVDPYITFWRPENCGYAFPLPWSGKYHESEVLESVTYYTKREGRSLIRFPVPCSVVDKLGVDPHPGRIDGDAGPVIVNDAKNRRKLRLAAFNPRNI